MGFASQKDTLLFRKGLELREEKCFLTRTDLFLDAVKVPTLVELTVLEHALLFVLLSKVSWLSISCISLSVLSHC
jgi:hypothetical protein